MKEYLPVLIVAALVGVVFAILWRTGQLARLRAFTQETKEELRKCTWPTWDELRGSTVVVMISILLLGLFTIVVDRLLYFLVTAMVKI
jgi:preprotein translocase subunit SecE